MPSYFYHLKLELYPTSDPTAPPHHHHHPHHHQLSPSETQSQPVWVPPSGADIFDNSLLPSHREIRSFSLPPARENPPQVADPPPAPAAAANSSVIDCGSTRRNQPENGASNSSNIVRLPKHKNQWQACIDDILPPPKATAAIKPQTAVNDWRFGPLSIESIDLSSSLPDAADADAMSTGDREAHASEGIGPQFPGLGTSTRAELIPVDAKSTNIGWGIVHFYREGQETPSLSLPPNAASDPADDDECTTLCIPAVPSYLSPADFLGFVGARWKGDISHYRMIMTPKLNRYLVLMKARDAERAKAWRREFDGKVFNHLETQVCHVVFVKSITFETPTDKSTNNPPKGGAAPPRASTFGTLKPLPPPTPDLVELPTCPVCLERMDDTTGLMTIPCQHVFHCSCLQSWSGTGCPVCRHTIPEEGGKDSTNPLTRPFGSHVSNLCSICDSTDGLWICLICGNVGCGRYKGAHAKDHWKETAHCFALEIETQYVWDYAEDMWVHRLIREKGGKILELPANNQPPSGGAPGPSTDEDLVPRAKVESMGLEYTHLLSSQLESQRAYFEEMVSKVADKAAKATAEAERAAAEAQTAVRRVGELSAELHLLKTETVPQLEKDLERERAKASKAQDLARSLGKSLQEEKSVSQGLMKRVEHVTREMDELKKRDGELRAQVAELEDTNRDLTAFISGGETLRKMQEEGQVEEGELEGGTVGVAEKSRRRRRK